MKNPNKQKRKATKVKVENVGFKGGFLRQRAIERIRNELVKHGISEEEANLAIADLEKKRPILEWLLDGGFQKLIEFIVSILKVV